MGRGHQTGRSAPGAALPGAAKPPGSRPLQPEDGPPRAQRGPRCRAAGLSLPRETFLTGAGARATTASPRELAGAAPASPWQRGRVESAEVTHAPHVTSGAFFKIKLLTRRVQRRPIIFHGNGDYRAGRITSRVVLSCIQEKH